MSDTSTPGQPQLPIIRWAHILENGVAVTALFLLVLFPLLEILLRSVFRTGLLGQSDYLAHFVLVVGFVGGMITARQRRHLSMGGGFDSSRSILGTYLSRTTAFFATTTACALGWSSLSFVLVGFGPGQMVGVVPVRLFAAAMPVAFFVMTVRFGLRFKHGIQGTLFFLLSVITGTFLAYSSLMNIAYILFPVLPEWTNRIGDIWYAIMPPLALPLVILLVASAFAGTPLFVVLAGTAFLLFVRSGGALEVIANEGYTMLTGGTIPAIPLFTFTGYLLSESKAGERLVRLFRSLFGWVPGGVAVAAVCSSVFFTSFTGASGVTILALGGLLFYILHTNGNQTERFSIGILASSSNVGLLFPPSLAIILYGTIAQVNIFHMFLGGILPGILLVLVFSSIGIVISYRRHVPTVRFDPADAWNALKESIWEVLLPVVIIVSFFSGLATLVETAAVAVLYTFIIEVLIHREISFRKLPLVALKCLAIVGGVLVILAAARGLSFYIIDAQVPVMLRDWVELHIHSRLLFLMLLNLVLLVTGCFMDIFSAILIVAPLVIPLGELFGVNPVHLGVIFLANLGLGFITPPVGLDLFLSSYRFGKALPQIYRYVFPFFLVEFGVVLVITYVPILATFLPGLVS